MKSFSKKALVLGVMLAVGAAAQARPVRIFRRLF